MSKYSIDSTTLSAIGSAIKTKKGSNSPILVSDFANEIANLASGGGDLSITRIVGHITQCRYNNTQMDYIIPIGDYLPSDLSKLKVLIGAVSNYYWSVVWYNNSSNLIEANVSSYVNQSGQVITNAGNCPILTNVYGFKVSTGTSNDRNPDTYGCYGLIDGKLYTLKRSGNNYIEQKSPDPSAEVDYDWFIIKEV